MNNRQQPRTAPYDIFYFALVEDRDEGLEQATPAGLAEDESEIIRWRSARSSRVALWTVAVSGPRPPVAPRAEAFLGDVVLFRSKITLTVPFPSPNGGLYWYVAGEYHFAWRKPRPVNGSIPIGKIPGAPGTPQTFPGTNFLPNVIYYGAHTAGLTSPPP